MNPKHNITIDDIARDLGVSKTTVSRAISGKGRIGPETRERVLEYIQAINYRPSATAKSLAESKTYNLAMVLPQTFIKLDLPFVRQYMSSICEEAMRRSYYVLLCPTTETESDPLVQALDHRKVDAVILTRTMENDPITELLSQRGIPFATIGSLPEQYRDLAVVEADHDQIGGCFRFTRQLLQGRPMKTALLGNDPGYVINQSRMKGFRLACSELGIPEEDSPIRFGLSTEAQCRAAVDELLCAGIRRFICTDQDICGNAMNYLRKTGLRIPQDVQLASLHDTEELEHMDPPVSGLRFDIAELARVTCRELLNYLNGIPHDAKPRLGYEIILRESTD